jgi:nicotinamidase-related amidase
MQISTPPKTALLLVDIQNDYFPGGKNELQGSPQAGEQAGRLLDYFRHNGQVIIHIQHLSTRPGAKLFLPGTPGAEIHASVGPLAGETVIQKHYPNSFRETTLLEYLHTVQATRLVIAGMMTHMCVEATTRAAFDFGLECLVAADACATKELSFQGQVVPAAQVHLAFLAALQGMYARVLTVDEVLNLLGS